jgi:UDP-N-acetylmuramate dehydrogenase
MICSSKVSDMQLLSQVQLFDYNTFRVHATANRLIQINQYQQIPKLLKTQGFSEGQDFILGGGSNTLLVRSSVNTIWQSLITGTNIVKESSKNVFLEIGAGENWHQLVEYAVNQGYAGIENLALIPGLVGGAPVQNLAAYGQNFSDVCHRVNAFDLHTGTKIEFRSSECQFGYRQSVFKHHPHRFLITSVIIKLAKNHTLNTSYFSIGGRYDSINKSLESQGISHPSIRDIFNAVIEIRQQKLPDVSKVPSVGSFFINPTITHHQLEQLKAQIPNLQYYPVEQLRYVSLEDESLAQADFVKVPVGRILQVLGWQGRQIGHCMIYPQWASIITHDGHATGAEIKNFADTIAKDVYAKLSVKLDSEVTII